MRRLLPPAATLLAAVALTAGAARAQSDSQPAEPAPASTGFGSYVAPPAVVKRRTYTLQECLALVDRNHPNVWAARARLAAVHAQLDEARWTPFWQGWNAGVNAGMLPPIGGTPMYSQSTLANLNPGAGGFAGWRPSVDISVNGVIPLYTFGKITSIREAAEANVRVNEWDLEKIRQQSRHDVRRAYFGLQLARDAKYLLDEILTRLDKGVEGIRRKLARSDASVAEWDKYRLEVVRDETRARVGEADRGAAMAMAGLRFLTGVPVDFDIPDEPLKLPDTPLVSVAQYLEAARLFRPETQMARAGIIARQRMVEFNRARLYPDIGLGLFAIYSSAPSATIQTNVWVPNSFNRFFVGGGVGLRWALDLMPQQARLAQAESQLEETRALERYSLGGVAVEVEHAYAQVVEAKVREENLSRAWHKALQWVVTISDAIDLGAQDERALLEPLRAYAFNRSAHLVALMDFNVQMSSLAVASGWDSAAPKGT